MQGTSILLVITGGIAAYKSLDLIRRFKERGAKVRCVMTADAHHFVTPLSVAALAEEPAFTDLFDLKNETEIGHIRLSREADLIVIAPATANLLAKMAHGLADDLASTMLLAANKPILAAPAMNWRMWENPATKRNVAQLQADGIAFVGPMEGSMACNEHGIGRMAEVADILTAAERMLTPVPRLLSGMHVLVTAGPTYEPLDPVRFIGNRSSGKQGYAIAKAAAAAGASVTLIAGPGALPDPEGVRTIHVETAGMMFEAVKSSLPADIAVFTAAVADWRPDTVKPAKIKKAGAAPSLQLVENPDILKAVSVLPPMEGRPRLVIGFAAETENVVEHAVKKLASKGCDLIVANDVAGAQAVFGSDRNTVHIVSKGGVETWPSMTKAEVAERLITLAASILPATVPTAAE
jgi:phosphopantothenoylcysteine decarboxylase/phosphopantothenate--cysteine ligase